MSRSRKRSALEHVVRYLQRRLDSREGWNNGNPETNGEYWLQDRVLPQARVVVDVGANVGDWSARCLTLNPAVELFAFEPSPQTADNYARRFAQQANVHLLRYGLGDSDGEAELCDYGENSGITSFHSRELSVGYTPLGVIRVQRRRLDGIAELATSPRIDLLKIDTEGGEMGVLRGASAWLADKKISLLQFEYGGAWIDAREFMADAHHMLKGYGYIIGRLLPRGVRWIEKFDHRDSETFKYANFIACPSRDEAERLGLLD